MSDRRQSLRPSQLFIAAAGMMRTCVESEPSFSKLMRGNDPFANGISVLRKVKMKLLKTCVLIADGARTRILENRGRGEGLPFAADHSPLQDLVEVRQGPGFRSHGPSRSAIEARSDPRRHLKSTVGGDMADILVVELEAGSQHRLVLVAAPATMGDLRGGVTRKVQAAIVGDNGNVIAGVHGNGYRLH